MSRIDDLEAEIENFDDGSWAAGRFWREAKKTGRKRLQMLKDELARERAKEAARIRLHSLPIAQPNDE